MEHVVALISIVLVLGLAGAGYEINPLHSEVKGLGTRVANINKALVRFYVQIGKWTQAKGTTP